MLGWHNGLVYTAGGLSADRRSHLCWVGPGMIEISSTNTSPAFVWGMCCVISRLQQTDLLSSFKRALGKILTQSTVEITLPVVGSCCTFYLSLGMLRYLIDTKVASKMGNNYSRENHDCFYLPGTFQDCESASESCTFTKCPTRWAPPDLSCWQQVCVLPSHPNCWQIKVWDKNTTKNTQSETLSSFRDCLSRSRHIHTCVILLVVDMGGRWDWAQL